MTQALIVGTGDGFSASFARRLAREGHAVALAARNVAKLAPLAASLRATTDATSLPNSATRVRSRSPEQVNG